MKRTALVVVMAAALIGTSAPAWASTSRKSSSIPTAKTVVQDLIARGLPAKLTIVYTAATDPNHLLGRPNGYLSKASFTDSRIPSSDSAGEGTGSVDAGGSVEVFSNASGATARAKYIESLEKADPILGTEYDYLNGSVLLRVSHYLTPTQARGYAQALAKLDSFAPAKASTTHSTYPLGSAKSCKARYVERILSHKVKGKSVKYIGCVYVTPKAKPKPTPKPTQPSMHQVGSGHASGDYAVATASGTANNPSKIELSITATPSQNGMVSWDLICTENGGGVGSKTGQSTLSLPAVEPLPLPAPSTSCIVSSDVQISGSGTVTISIKSST